MRDIMGVIVGLVLGATITSIVYITNDTKERREAASMVPIEQCIAALLSREGRP